MNWVRVGISRQPALVIRALGRQSLACGREICKERRVGECDT
jgi:hypothetical protein